MEKKELRQGTESEQSEEVGKYSMGLRKKDGPGKLRKRTSQRKGDTGKLGSSHGELLILS